MDNLESSVRSAQAIIESFRDLKDKLPQEFIAGVRENELKLVELRNSFIDIPTQQRSPAQTAKLDKINTALSLVIAVEYPVSELERNKLNDAMELLKTL